MGDALTVSFPLPRNSHPQNITHCQKHSQTKTTSESSYQTKPPIAKSSYHTKNPAPETPIPLKTPTPVTSAQTTSNTRNSIPIKRLCEIAMGIKANIKQHWHQTSPHVHQVLKFAIDHVHLLFPRCFVSHQ